MHQNKGPEGLDIIVVIDELFKQFDDWKDIGLGRMTIHEAFEYSLALDNVQKLQ